MEVCRGQHAFSGGCRGDWDSMSWGKGMSLKYVVDNMRFLGDVVGTGIVYVSEKRLMKEKCFCVDEDESERKCGWLSLVSNERKFI